MSETKRKRRTAEEIFLDKLSKLTKGELTLVSNATLRDELGWDEDKYANVRLQLRKEGRINVGQGQGGKVGLAQVPNAKALKIFISYSHQDQDLKSEFEKHLFPLKRLKLVETWHDGKITAGKDLDKSISSELSSSDMIVLLVSIDYINSYYCIEIEMERAMERHDSGTSRVIPIILRNCMWQHMPFSKLKALPHDAKAVNSWGDRDEALATVAQSIREVALELMEGR